MTLLGDREAECSKWKDNVGPYAMNLFSDYRNIAQGCIIYFNGDNGYEVVKGADKHIVNLDAKKGTCRAWDLTGIPCPHAIRALLHKKQDLLREVHWWYSKDACMMVYAHKLQPVRGENFWKVEPHHAMEPPEETKMAGRPKVKRTREKDEARKREGVWSANRKGLLMLCGHCGAIGHNIRKCALVAGSSQIIENVPSIAPQDSQTSEYLFMLTPGLSVPSARPSSQSLNAQFDDDFGEDSGDYSDPVLRPKVICEARTMLQRRKLLQKPTGTRLITFVGYDSGTSIPTNLPYSPKKVTWKGKAAMTSK